MPIDLPVLAGLMSTCIFATSTLPMLVKAWRTRDLHSYSYGTLTLANGGNLIHSVYIFSLPPGPIWALHTFHLVTTGLMLVWYLRFERKSRQRMPSIPAATVDGGLDDLLMVGP